MNICDLPLCVVNQIISHLYENRDRCSLSQTCKQMNDLAMPFIYTNILVTNKKVKQVYSPYDNDPPYTECTPTNLVLLLRTLREHPNHIQIIHRLLIDCDMYDLPLTAIQPLIDQLLNWKEANARYPLQFVRDIKFVNHDVGLLEIVSKFSEKYYRGCGMLYENDEYEDYYEKLEKIQDQKKIPLMDTYLIKDWDEVFLLPKNLPFGLQIGSNHGMDSRPLSSHIVGQLSSLNISSLEFISVESLASFVTPLLESHVGVSKMLFPSVKQFSITISNLAQLKLLPALIDFITVEELELRFANHVPTRNDKRINASSLPILNELLHSGIRKLSFVNLNYNNLLDNNSIANDELTTDSNPYYYIMQHCSIFNRQDYQQKVKFLLISLNNFFCVPHLSEEISKVGTFQVSQEYSTGRLSMFKKYLGFTSCKTLVIPDYLFNWKPFFNFENDQVSICTDISNKRNFFTTCKCELCQCIRKKLDERGNESFEELYRQAAQEFYMRMPRLDKVFGIHFFDLPFTNGPYNKDVHNMSLFVLHNLIPDISFFVKKYSQLQTLCLGGLLFFIRRTPTNIKVYEPYIKSSLTIDN